jgi:hypothetical protein
VLWQQVLLVVVIVVAGALAGLMLRRRLAVGGALALGISLVPILGLCAARAWC